MNFGRICMFLLIVSGLLWGVYGLFDLNLISYFSDECWFTRTVMAIFGIAGLATIAIWGKRLRK